MSLVILYGESTLFVTKNISILWLIIDNTHEEIEIQLICLAPLLYLVICTYVPLFQLKLKGRYGLYKNNHTDPANLIWSACFMARLIPALSYNFVLLAHIDSTEFGSVISISSNMGNIEGYFSVFFPLILTIFCFLNGFDIYGRLMSSIGLSQLTFAEVLDKSRLEEGKSLIAKARVEKERKIKEANSYTARIIGGAEIRTDTDESKRTYKSKEQSVVKVHDSSSIRGENEEVKQLKKPLRNS